MCEAKPGVRCAADTSERCTDAVAANDAANPGGPDVEPLAAAAALMVQPNRIKVTDRLGRQYELDPTVLDDDAKWVLTNGRCADLALALSRANGWRVALHTVDQYDDDGEFVGQSLSHVLAVNEFDLLVDAEGVWTGEEYDRDALSENSNLTYVNADVARRTISGYPGFEDVDPDAVAAFVPTIHRMIEEVAYGEDDDEPTW